MKLVAALLLALLAPWVAAQGLSHSEVLAAMDDASAAEARWILASGFLATGAVGVDGHMPRAAYAFERLVREGKSENFELLTKSANDVAVAYGIKGLEQLAPEKLPELLPQLVLRRRMFEEGSGCIGGENCVAHMLLSAIEDMDRNRTVIGSAWKSYLAGLPDAGGSAADPAIVRKFKAMLGDVPRAKPAPACWPYILAMFESELRPALRKTFADDPSGVAGRLALACLAGLESSRDATRLFTQIWRRQPLMDDATIDIQVHAAFWGRRLAETTASIAAGKALSMDEACPWQTLTQKDWEWLCAQADPGAAEAAKQLRANPITGWRLDTDAPSDPDARRIWLLLAARECAKEDSPNAKRAQVLLLDLLEADANALYSPSLIDEVPLEVYLAEVFTHEQLLPVAAVALKSKAYPVMLAGAHIVAAFCERESDWEDTLGHSKTGRVAVERLETRCNDDSDDRVWDLRLSYIAITSTLAGFRIGARGVAIARKDDWARKLVQKLAGNPRAMPLPVRLASGLDDVAFSEFADDRTAELLDGIYSGGAEFLPVHEVPHRSKEEQLPTASMIYQRMQAALAKLDD